MNGKICLIDDSLVMRSILRKAIQMSLFHVDRFLEAKNGLEGFRMLKENQENLDIAFLDLHMPEMNGVELLKKLQDEGYRAVPIIIVTTSADSHTQQRCTELGAVGFVHKPFTPLELGSELIRVVGEP